VPFAATRPRLWYERRGRGEPLLAIPGFGISSAVFEPVADLYSPWFDCIAYDNRGSGRSQAPARPTSIPELAGDAIALLDFLEIESAHVYGLSMGGMIAQELALRFPHRVRGLILGCTTAGGPRAALPSPLQLKRLGDPSPRELLDPVGGWLGTLMFSKAFRRAHPARARRLTELFVRDPPPAHGLTAQWWATFFHDTGSRLHRITAPTLVLHGELDAFAPVSNARFLAARIPGAQLRIIDGAGHAYALEAPERSRNLLLDWFRAQGRIAPGLVRTDPLAKLEPITRAAGLPLGVARTGASLGALVRNRLTA
jgi:pimeloyl-ACP methyl ester carboxylesterase